MGMRPVTSEIWQAYSTVRGWLLRMMGTDTDRQIDKKRCRKKKKLDAAARKAILEGTDNSPTKYGFAAGTWRLDTMSAMLSKGLNI